MKNILYKISTLVRVAFLACVVVLAGCDGKEGDPGPAGTNGTDGTTGTNGVNGTGYENEAKYGGVTLTISGQRPDGEDFRKVVEIPFLSNGNLYASDINTSEGFNFNIDRVATAADGEYSDTYVHIQGYNGDGIQVSGDTLFLVTGEGDSQWSFAATLLFNEDHTFFDISNSFLLPYLTNFSYTEETGAFTGAFEQEFYYYDYLITVEGVINVTLYEGLEF